MAPWRGGASLAYQPSIALEQRPKCGQTDGLDTSSVEPIPRVAKGAALIAAALEEEVQNGADGAEGVLSC